MEVRFTSHAENRLLERRISKRTVREALTHGRIIQSGQTAYAKGGRKLIVIYNVLGESKYLIITAYYEN